MPTNKHKCTSPISTTIIIKIKSRKIKKKNSNNNNNNKMGIMGKWGNEKMKGKEKGVVGPVTHRQRLAGDLPTVRVDGFLKKNEIKILSK